MLISVLTLWTLGGLNQISGQVIFKLISVIYDWSICFEIYLGWFSLGLTHDKWTLVQVMAWCHQATSHYLSQCWPRFMSPYGVTRPKRVIKCHLSGNYRECEYIFIKKIIDLARQGLINPSSVIQNCVYGWKFVNFVSADALCKYLVSAHKVDGRSLGSLTQSRLKEMGIRWVLVFHMINSLAPGGFQINFR